MFCGGKYRRYGCVAAVPMQVITMPSGEYPLKVYASPFLHGRIRGSTNFMHDSSQIHKMTNQCGTYMILWAREVATRNIDGVPNVGSSPMVWNLTYIL